jgi:hypothetical protein
MNLFALRRRSSPTGRAAGSGETPVIQFSPAPESALPLMPALGSAEGSEIEFRALLLRLPPERERPSVLLSVHTLRGVLDQPLCAAAGPQGEYALSFVPRRSLGPGRVILADFRFAPSPGRGPATEVRGADVTLTVDLPCRIEPPMEPDAEGALALQITAHLRGRQEPKP